MVDQAEIHRKVASDKVEERREAVDQLRDNFADLPDKEEAWNDLIRLTEDEDDFVRWHAADALGSVFQHVPKRKEAWRCLHRLTGDKDGFVRTGVAYALGYAFQHVPDKEEAWNDLIRMTEDEYNYVRCGAIDAIGFAVLHIPDKREAWQDLIRLTDDTDWNVQCHAADALDSVFQHVPERKEAWGDLHRLTEDDDWGVRYGAARVIGSIFPHLPDKKEAWQDLIRLTDDKDWDAPISARHPLLKTDEAGLVRISANHSMGRASIFKAIDTENEDDFKSELKNAIKFFEKSSKEATFFINPSRFCLPFYRSFYTITFEKAGAEGVVQRYLAEAKKASEGSENKETLLEAVENLANALSEAHKVTDFGAMKSNLNAYRQYCDRAADLICDAEEETPGAARILRRGMPIIGERIREIQEKAEALCRETRGTGTPYEPLGTEVNKWARDLSDRGYLRDEKDIPRIRNLLGQLCSLLHEDDQDYPCKIVEGIREGRKPEDTLSDIATALSYLVPSIRLQPQINKTISDGQPSQKTSHSTTVFAGAYSTVVVPHTETESGDVTVNTAVTEESQPDTQPDRSSKRTAIEISADIAVHVLVYTVLHHFAEDLMP